MSAQISAVVSYENATTDIQLEFDSKNKLPVDTVVLDDSVGVVIQVDYSKEHTDSVTLAEEILVSAQYNLVITDSISSSETFAWTTVQNLTDSVNTGDTPGIGQIHKVYPTDSVSVADIKTTYHDGMLNTNMLNTRLISLGSLEILVYDVTIT